MAPNQPSSPATPALQSEQPQPAAVTADAAPAASVATAPADNKGLVLPLAVISKADISRTLREVQLIDEYFRQAAIRGSKEQVLPRQSQVLEALVQTNQLNLLHAESRQKLIAYLDRLKETVPVVHMSFPSEPTGEFTMRIVEWFRREIHPNVVLHVGLQPALAAGCTVRTTNKVFDFSFRKRFEKSKEKLVAALEASA